MPTQKVVKAMDARKLIPRGKLGKKARRAQDLSQRVEWTVKPVTRIVESKKHYSRKRKAHDRMNDDVGFLLQRS